MYIYKRNDNSLNTKKGCLMDIKNRIYRLKTLIKINENLNIYKNYYNYYKTLNNIIKYCNSSILKDNLIRKNLIKISIKFLSIFKNDKNISKNINNNIINKISDNKIIFFFNSFYKSLIDYINIFSIYCFLEKNKDRKIISIDINDIIQVNNISKYIYSNDILLGLNNIAFHENFRKILKIFNKKKIILLNNNNFFPSQLNNNLLNNSCNSFIYSFVRNSTFINSIMNYKLINLEIDITNFPNYFNFNKNNNNNCKLTIIYKNYSIENIKKIKNISSKYYQKLIFIKLHSILNNFNIINLIKKSALIITDNIYIMEISSLFFTSCILYGNFPVYDENIKYLLFHLNYIKCLNDINKLENNIIELKNNSYKYNMEINYKKLDKIIRQN